MREIHKILSTFRKNGLFQSDGSLVQREKGKASRTASQRPETFAHQLAGPATANMGRAPRPRCMYGGIGQSEQDDEMGAVCHRHVTDAFHRGVVIPVQLGSHEIVSVCNVSCPRFSIGLFSSWKDKKLR